MQQSNVTRRLIVWGVALTALAALVIIAGGAGVLAQSGTPIQATVGNPYPAGPAPTSIPVSSAKAVTLNIPTAFANGGWTTPHVLTLPAGFAVSLYALPGGGLRFMAFSPDNVLFGTEMGAGKVVRIVDSADKSIGQDQVWLDGLQKPHGLAFYTIGSQVYLYVAEFRRVTRYKYAPGQIKAGPPEVIIPDLPSSNDHITRTLAFGMDGKLYISIGSGCNVCEEDEARRATVMQFNPDGSGGKIYASGLRNGVGLAINPTTGELWEAENSRDNLGDNLPPDEINILKDGANYGWPYCVSNKVWDQNFGKRDQAFCDTTIAPALPLQAHSAPLGITFYTGHQFPEDYQGDAFVAFHGSWNRTQKTGYKLVRVHVKDGRPTTYEDFMTGFLNGAVEWGRPVDSVVGPDGSLYLSDDANGAIYKITYIRK